MVTEVRAGLSPGALAQGFAADGAKPADKVAQPATSFEPVVIKKPEIKVDVQEMRQNLQQAINHLNELMRDGGRGLNFSMDPTLSRPIVYVRNADTGEVIRQIPSEVVVRIAHGIEDFKGMLHNASS